MFEKSTEPVLPHKHFVNRVLMYSGLASCTIACSLLLGMVGYRFFADISWTDAFYNASMILTGMGPALDIDALPLERQNPTKIFAGCYAIYSGVVFLVASGLVVTPLLHRLLHRMHFDWRG